MSYLLITNILNKIYLIDYFEIFEEPIANPVGKIERLSLPPSTYFLLLISPLSNQKALSGSPVEIVYRLFRPNVEFPVRVIGELARAEDEYCKHTR